MHEEPESFIRQKLERVDAAALSDHHLYRKLHLLLYGPVPAGQYRPGNRLYPGGDPLCHRQRAVFPAPAW